MKKRFLSSLLALVMAVALLPGTAFAADGTTHDVGTLEQLTQAIADTSVDTITLTEDITNVDTPITISRSLTLDLGTKTISGSLSRANNSKGLITVSGANITVTIKNGYIKSNNLCGIVTSYATRGTVETLVLQDLNVEATGESMFAVRAAANDTVRAESGKYKGTHQFPVNCIGDCYFGAGVTIISSAKGMTPFGNSGSDNAAEVPEGYYADVKTTDGETTLKVVEGSAPVISDSNYGGNFYQTLTEAIKAGKENLYLYSDVGSAEHPAESVEIPAGKTITITCNLNNAKSPNGTLIYYGDITVNGKLVYSGSDDSNTGIIGNITFGDNGTIEFNNTYHFGIFSTDFRDHITGEYTLEETESDYTDKPCWKLATAYIRGGDVDGKTYSSINQAIAKDAAKITLEKDHRENVTVSSGKTLTINLNNKTLRGGVNGKVAAVTVENGGSLTIKNGTVISGPGYYHAEEYAFENHGTLTLENVVVNGVSYRGGMTGVVGNSASNISQNALIRSDGTLNINGGHISNTLMLPPYPYGSDALGPLEGEEYDGGLGVLIYGGEATINNAIIYAGYNGVYASDGKVTITGENTNIQWAGNSLLTPTPEGRHVEAVDAADDSMITITGGKYNSNVSRFVPESCITTKTGEGTSGDSCEVKLLDNNSAAKFLTTKARIIFLKDIHTEGENTYQIILEGKDSKSIYQFKKAVLSFMLSGEPHLTYKIIPASNVTLTENSGGYTFVPAEGRTLSGNRIVLGTAVFSGIGKGAFSCDGTKTNSATAATYNVVTDTPLELSISEENISDRGDNLTAYGKNAPVKITSMNLKAGETYTDWNGVTLTAKTDAELTYAEENGFSINGTVSAAFSTTGQTLKVNGTTYTAGDADTGLEISNNTVTASEGSRLTGNTVYKQLFSVSVTSTPTGTGTVTATPQSAAKGTSVSVTVSPASGYELDRLTATASNNNSVELTPREDGGYTFTMPDSNVSITAVFVKINSVTPSNPSRPSSPSRPSKPTAPTIPVIGSDDSTNVSVQVQENAASVGEMTDETLQSILESKENEIIEFDCSSLGETIDSVELPIGNVETIAQAANNPDSHVLGMSVHTTSGIVSFDAQALQSIVSQANHHNIELHVDDVSTDSLNQEQSDAVESLQPVDAVDVYLVCNGSKISDFGDGNVRIYVPFTPPEGKNPNGFFVWYVPDDGSSLDRRPTSYDSEKKLLSFRVHHFSDYVIAYMEPNEILSCQQESDCPIYPFTDADAEEWYHDGVHYVLSKGLMVGTADKVFAPGTTVSRAMVAQILYANAKKPPVTESASFSDVATDAWYAKAVAWAEKNGAAAGYGDTTFRPDRAVTREELAAMLYSAAAKPPVKAGTLNSYPDASSVSDWAQKAVLWATQSGIITGDTSGTKIVLNPTKNATRAQLATMIMQYIEK